jgi:hypothetical protein
MTVDRNELSLEGRSSEMVSSVGVARMPKLSDKNCHFCIWFKIVDQKKYGVNSQLQ